MSWTNVHIPVLNTMRLRPNDNSIDYYNVFPRLDLMTQREVYQKGEKALGVYVDWAVHNVVRFQIQVETISLRPSGRLYNLADMTYQTLYYTDITPAGWVGYYVYEFYLSIWDSGYYYISFSFPTITTQLVSDIFYVSDSVSTDKNLVKIQYRNSYNRDGMVWGDRMTLFGYDWYYHVYFTGFTEPGTTQTENSISEEDDGVNIYNSISYPGITLTLTEIHKTQLRQIEKIMTCDELFVNGESVICKSGIEKNRIEKSDCYNITANLTLKNIDNYMNYD